MAFIVEDGTGLESANSLVTIEFADLYFLERGNAAWSGTNNEKQSYLILGTDYVSLKSFKGYKKVDSQALPFPRIICGVDEMPLNMLKAVCEYALRAKRDDLMPDPVYNSSGVRTIATKKKLGPLEIETAVVGSQSGPLIRPYPYADSLLRPYLAASMSGRTIR